MVPESLKVADTEMAQHSLQEGIFRQNSQETVGTAGPLIAAAGPTNDT